MADDFEFTIKTAGIEKALADLARETPLAAGAALREEAEIEMTEAKHRTPVLTGALRASGHVTEPEIHGNAIEVKLGFGGPAAPYALFVHENLEAFHTNGQAKFLESVLAESVSHLPNRIADRLARKLASAASATVVRGPIV